MQGITEIADQVCDSEMNELCGCIWWMYMVSTSSNGTVEMILFGQQHTWECDLSQTSLISIGQGMFGSTVRWKWNVPCMYLWCAHAYIFCCCKHVADLTFFSFNFHGLLYDIFFSFSYMLFFCIRMWRTTNAVMSHQAWMKVKSNKTKCVGPWKLDDSSE